MMVERLTNGEYKVDLETLDTTTEEVRSLGTFVADHTDEVKRAVALLFQAWQGIAAGDTGQTFDRWQEDVKKLQHGIKTMHEAARTAHDNYSGTIAANLNMLGRS